MAAIEQVWPQHLRKQVNVVLNHENRKHNPGSVGQNTDKYRSRDHGCIQINDYWWFNKGNSPWNKSSGFDKIYDPVFNLQTALFIYQDAEKRLGNGWIPWYGARGIYW